MKRALASGFCVFVCAATTATAAQRLSFFKGVETVLTDQPIAGAAAGDVNGDGLLDLITASPADGAVHVALGVRKGGFRAPVAYAVPAGSGDLALADVNNDGALDIVVDVFGIGVLLGHGDGTFDAPIVTRGRARFVIVTDFDGDGFDDVASVGKNATSMIPDTVDIYPGLGNGSFGAPITLASSDNSPQALATGDFNGDGAADLAFAQGDTRSLHIYLNRGALTFGLTESVAPLDPGRILMTVADLDGNGTDDVVAVGGFGTISIFPGDGTGRLQARRNYSVGASPCGQFACPEVSSMQVVDVDGDGLLDVIAAIHDPGNVAVLLNAGGGTLSGPATMDLPRFAELIVVGDFDGDQAVDLAVIGSSAGSINDAGTRIVTVFLSRLHQKARQR